MKNTPKITDWLFILRGHITQHDLRQSKTRYYNPYALPQYFEALERIREALKGSLDSSSPESLEALVSSINRNFVQFPPANALLKKIERYKGNGKPPSYPSTKR